MTGLHLLSSTHPQRPVYLLSPGSSVTVYLSSSCPEHMAFMFNARQPATVSSRARAEAYAGLLLLVFGVTVLAFNRCPNESRWHPARRPFATNPKHSGDTLPEGVTVGYAAADGRESKGWWVGHFAPEGPRRTEAVETKWIVHPPGRTNEGFVANKRATSMAVLIAGRHRIEFAAASVILEFPGDYVIWGPGVAHSWTALSGSTMLCVRWPSVPADQSGVVGEVRNLSSTISSATRTNVKSGVDETLPVVARAALVSRWIVGNKLNTASKNASPVSSVQRIVGKQQNASDAPPKSMPQKRGVRAETVQGPDGPRGSNESVSVSNTTRRAGVTTA